MDHLISDFLIIALQQASQFGGDFLLSKNALTARKLTIPHESLILESAFDNHNMTANEGLIEMVKTSFEFSQSTYLAISLNFYLLKMVGIGRRSRCNSSP